METADSDNDGVGDDYDQCPGSAAGAVVDASGCDAPTDGTGDGASDGADTATDAGMDDSATGVGLPGEDAALHDAPSAEAAPAEAAPAADSACRVPEAGEQIDDNGCAVN
jgi:OOP family OmpA-OmpF porin